MQYIHERDYIHTKAHHTYKRDVRLIVENTRETHKHTKETYMYTKETLKIQERPKNTQKRPMCTKKRPNCMQCIHKRDPTIFERDMRLIVMSYHSGLFVYI